MKTKTLYILAGLLIACYTLSPVALYISYYVHIPADCVETDCPTLVTFKVDDNTMRVCRAEDLCSSITRDYRDKSFIEWLFDRDWYYDYRYEWSRPMLDTYISSISKDSVDSKLVVSSDYKVSIVAGLRGFQYDTDAVFERLVSGDTRVDISDLNTATYITPEDLQEEFEEQSWINNWSVSYDSGYIISYADYMNAGESWNDFLTVISEQYDTTGNTLQFVPTGEDLDPITVKYKTFGYSLDSETEQKFLQECFDNHMSVTDQHPVLTGYDDVDDSYIEISLDQQHLWHYVAGELCCETDVVTGLRGLRDTPTGVFFISERVNGKYLRGDDYVTWVNKWMRITNSGVGLHDATWRSSFGGKIYTYNGSHGCINMPKKFAYNLYDETYVGLPVIIY